MRKALKSRLGRVHREITCKLHELPELMQRKAMISASNSCRSELDNLAMWIHPVLFDR